MLFIGDTAVLVVKSAKKQCQLPALIREVFGKNASVRVVFRMRQPALAIEIRFLNDSSIPGHIVGIYLLYPIREAILSSPRSFLHLISLCPFCGPEQHFLFKLCDGNGRSCDCKIRKILIQPDHLFVRDSDVLCHQRNIIPAEHVRIDKAAGNPGISKDRSPIGLCIFHSAGCPANSPVKIINHAAPLSGKVFYGIRTCTLPSFLRTSSPRRMFRMVSFFMRFSIF